MNESPNDEDIFKGLSRRKRHALKRGLSNASTQGEKHGCADCGVSLASWPLPYLVGTRQGKYAAVCQSCRDTLDDNAIYAVQWETESLWKISDRVWFDENPEREYRLREPIGQELAALELANDKRESIPTDAVIIVWQKENGVRVRAPIRRPIGPLSSFTKAGIAKFFSMATPGGPQEFIKNIDGEEFDLKIFCNALERVGVQIKGGQ